MGFSLKMVFIVCAHTVVPQKSSSNPAFPCSASRIKALEASPSSPMKLIDSLYRDADRKVVHTGGILPWPSAKHVVLTNQSLRIGRQTYLIFVSAPLAASAGARAAAPSAPRRFSLRLRNKREHATGHQQANGGSESSLDFGRQSYSIFVSPPLTRRASAIAVMPSAV